MARRVAHEIKNPLTPIALSAERIERQVDRLELAAAVLADTARMRADHFEIGGIGENAGGRVRAVSPAFPRRSRCGRDLNAVVREALAVFQGRLEGIAIRTSFAPGLPPVNLDREQFQRVVVNLVDNAAEAMQDSLVKRLYIATQPGAGGDGGAGGGRFRLRGQRGR